MAETRPAASLRQVAVVRLGSCKLKIFRKEEEERQRQPLFILEPILDWERDNEGRPRITAVARVGGGAVYELNMLVSTEESEEAALECLQQRFAGESFASNFSLITHVDYVQVNVECGDLGLLKIRGDGVLYPSKRTNNIKVSFESEKLSANDIETVRQILRTTQLNMKAIVDGFELAPTIIDFETVPVSPTTREKKLEEENKKLQKLVKHLAESPKIITPDLPPTKEVKFATDPTIRKTSSSPPPLPLASSPSPSGSRSCSPAPPAPLPPSLPSLQIAMKFPILDVAWTLSGNLVVITGNRGVHIVNPTDGSIVRSIGSIGTGVAQFQNAAGVAVSPDGLLFITDYSLHRVLVFTEEGYLVKNIGCGPGHLPGQLNAPFGIAASKSEVYVVDYNNSRIQVFSHDDGVFVRQFASKGSQPGQLNHPVGIALDHEENCYISESGDNRVSVFSNDGSFLEAFGTSGSEPGQFSSPHHLCIDPVSRYIVVADYGNKRIQVLRKNGSVVRCIDVSKDIVDPCGVAINDKGHLAIGGNRSKLLSFQTISFV